LGKQLKELKGYPAPPAKTFKGGENIKGQIFLPLPCLARLI